jgi:hypothetical protein
MADVTRLLDPAGHQKESAWQVWDRGRDYLLAETGNQPTLHEAVSAVIDPTCEAELAGVEYDGHMSAEDGHGRHEERYVTIPYNPGRATPGVVGHGGGTGLAGAGGEGASACTAHEYASSLRVTVAELGRLVRRYWAVENELH